MKSMKKLVLAGLVLLASVMVLVGCDTNAGDNPSKDIVPKQQPSGTEDVEKPRPEQPSSEAGEEKTPCAEGEHRGGTATCSAKASCSECGFEYGECNLENLESEGFTYTKHDENTHIKKRVCCETETAENHRGGTATCSAKGSCSECGFEYGECNLENHESEGFTYTKQDENTHIKKRVCCETETAENHRGGTATCSAKATCSDCVDSYGVLNPENHELDKKENFFTLHECCGIHDIDGTLGGRDATNDDVTELQNFFMSSVDAGNTTFVVTGETQAMYNNPDYGSYPFVGSVLYEMGFTQYNGTINLIYRDVTEIVEFELEANLSLKTLTLPKVIKCGNEAFSRSSYLEKITFGSVVTSVGEDAFKDVGGSVNGGCELVLNKEQVNVEGLAPDLEAKTWAGHTWKSITLQ